MSFDLEKIYKVTQFTMSQSLWNRAMSFDNSKKMRLWGIIMSQSLWNRAMSFDIILRLHLDHVISCLNPFGTGQCLSTQGTFNKKRFSPVSIPLEQGNVFRPNYAEELAAQDDVSIPLEQGNVFRLVDNLLASAKKLASQSLWNRAMSFDLCLVLIPLFVL